MSEIKPYIYLQKIEIFNNIKFTLREVDVISCILTGKIAKSMSTVLGVETRTYESHYSNIKKKLQINTKEQLIDLIDACDLREYYKAHSNLLKIEKTIKDQEAIQQLSHREFILYFKDTYNKIIFLELLKRHLNVLNIKIRVKPYKPSCFKFIENQHFDFFLISDNAFDENEKKPVFVCSLDTLTEKNTNAGTIHLREFTNYFDFLFLLADRLNSNSNLFLIKSKIDDALLNKIEFFKQTPTLQQNHIFSIPKTAKKLIMPILVFSGVLTTIVSSALFFKGADEKGDIIRSLFPLPTKSILLKRMDVIEKIDKILCQKTYQQQKINYAVLIGLAGSGKTTLATAYAKQHNGKIVYTLNSQSYETLKQSYMQLAYALAKTPEEKDELIFINNITNQKAFIKQLLNFIQKHLKNSKDWLLIFDNVILLNDIANILPNDVETWGTGKVIITTHNSNIEFSNLIEANKCIQVKELSTKDSADLFCAILYSSPFTLLSKKQQQEIQTFLKQIPNFPLDITLAAYYVKQTNTKFNEYLKDIYRNEATTSKTNEQIIKENTQYPLSRQNLIETSFKQIFLIDSKFRDILFFVSLFNYKQIPKNLLTFHFNEDTVNAFIIILKKYSLLTEEVITNNGESSKFISFHPYIQNYGKLYFKTTLDAKKFQDSITKSAKNIKLFFDSIAPYQYDDIYVQCLPHLKVFLEHLKDSPNIEAIQLLHFLIGKIYFIGTRELSLARAHFEKTLSCKKLLSFSKLEQVNLYRDLANICDDMEDAKCALYYAKEALAIIKKEPSSSQWTFIKAQLYFTTSFANLFLNEIFLAKKNFKQALSLIKKDDSKKSIELRSCIISHQGWLHAVTYLTKPEGECSILYADDALEIIKSSGYSLTRGKVSRFIVYHHITRGDVLCRLGKFQQALTENFEKVQQFFDNQLTVSPHIISKIYLDIGFGECWLRTGQLDKAIKVLKNVITKGEQLLGKNSSLMFYPYVFLMECYLRLGKLDLATEQLVSLMGGDINSNTNHSQFIEGLLHYNAMLLYTKKNDIEKTEEHLALFIKKMSKFLKFFYSDQEYLRFEKNELLELNTNSKDIQLKLKICKTILNTVYKNIDFFE